MMTFLAQEVINQVEGLNSEKTLKRWTDLVKEYFGSDYFKTENIPFNSNGNKRPVIVYSQDDVTRFQSVAHILSTQPTNRKNLKEAIRMAFSSEVPFTKPKEDWEVALDVLKEEFQNLQSEDKRLLRAIQDINRKISQMEEELTSMKDKRSGFLRRK